MCSVQSAKCITNPDISFCPPIAKRSCPENSFFLRIFSWWKHKVTCLCFCSVMAYLAQFFTCSPRITTTRFLWTKIIKWWPLPPYSQNYPIFSITWNWVGIFISHSHVNQDSTTQEIPGTDKRGKVFPNWLCWGLEFSPKADLNWQLWTESSRQLIKWVIIILRGFHRKHRIIFQLPNYVDKVSSKVSLILAPVTVN